MLGATFRSFLFLPVLAYCGMMIASTPVFGGHYFVDLIAGTALALVVLLVVARLPGYRGLFARSAGKLLSHPLPAN